LCTVEAFLTIFLYTNKLNVYRTFSCWLYKPNFIITSLKHSVLIPESYIFLTLCDFFNLTSERSLCLHYTILPSPFLIIVYFILYFIYIIYYIYIILLYIIILYIIIYFIFTLLYFLFYFIFRIPFFLQEIFFIRIKYSYLR
jgi:hypothetical protein